MNFTSSLILEVNESSADTVKTRHLRKPPFLWEWLFLLWVRRKYVPKDDYCRTTGLITLVLFHTTYLTNELHTHTHTHTHTHLLTLSPVQTKPAFTDTRWCSQTEAAGHRWRQRLAWRFHAGDFLFSSHRLFCFYFFPLLCKVRAVTRPPTQTPLAVQENFSRTQNTWKFLWPANGNLRIDNATNHSSHETR